jgi:phosphopantetheinyl transferase (holo-ACP synthase)
MELNKTVVSDSESFYVIVLKYLPISTFPYKKRGLEKNRFFKSNNYRTFGSQIQSTDHACDAKQWKTKEGAAKALAALVEKGEITGYNPKAMIGHYTRSVHTRCDIVTDTANNLELVEAN